MQTPLQLPRELERDSKVYGAPGYRHHPIWSRGGRGHPDSAKVWAAFTGGKRNECDLWAGPFGPIQCPLVVVSPSYHTVGIDVLYGCTSSSCRCHRGVSPEGRAARRKVLVPSGPTALLTMLGYKSLLICDFTDWHVGQREVPLRVLDSVSLPRCQAHPFYKAAVSLLLGSCGNGMADSWRPQESPV